MSMQRLCGEIAAEVEWVYQITQEYIAKDATQHNIVLKSQMNPSSCPGFVDTKTYQVVGTNVGANFGTLDVGTTSIFNVS